MEGYQELKPFDVDIAALKEYKTVGQIVKGVIFQVATALQWSGLSGTAENYTITVEREKYMELDGKGYVYTACFKGKDDFSCNTVLLIHFDTTDKLNSAVLTVFVFPWPSIDHDGYYEHGGERCFREGAFVIYERHETYAWEADIHDHDHYELTAQVKYDTTTHKLYAPQ